VRANSVTEKLFIEQLKTLQSEYDENATRLAHHLEIGELERLRERCQDILREARVLTREMSVPGTQWLYLA
jgi:hypothetical protein